MALLFVGRSTFDLGYVCPAYPAEDAKLSATHFWAGAGGCALNAAVTAQALGSEARLATLLGGGPFADAVRSELDGFGVGVEDFAALAANILPVSSIVVVPAQGSRTVIDQQPSQVPARAADPDRLLEGIDLVLSDGFLPDLAVPICRQAQARGIPVVLDGGSWKPWSGEILRHVDVAIVSERFRPNRLEALHALGPSRTAITRGNRPILWSDGAQSGEIAPPHVDAIDTLGAGDVFHGAFCHFLTAGNDFLEALRLASKIAAESCRHYGPRAWID